MLACQLCTGCDRQGGVAFVGVYLHHQRSMVRLNDKITFLLRMCRHVIIPQHALLQVQSVKRSSCRVNMRGSLEIHTSFTLVASTTTLSLWLFLR